MGITRLPRPLALVGAGPGDPGLLTRRGQQLLSRAEVVLYDGLCNPQILQLAPRAELVCVGKHGQARIWTQTEINEAMVRYWQSGRRVVRLKGGDPAVFARTSEEIAALRAAGIPFEVVPGVTAALAASSYAGIPVTHRGLASAVALVTGHEEPSKQVSALDWKALAEFPGTLVIYMGVTTVNEWTQQLITHGKPPETPVAILRRCSLPDQQIVHCRLDEVAQRLTPATKMRPPVLSIVGPVAELPEEQGWFASRPLFGQRILITRPQGQGDTLSELICDLGGDPVVQPAIEIGPCGAATEADHRLREAIAQLDQYQLIAFSSRHGVEYFFAALLEHGRDARALARLTIAAVGKGTVEELSQHGIVADIVPSGESNAAELVAALAPQAGGMRVLLPRASRGADTLPRGLRDAGAEVTEVVAYMHTDVEAVDQQVADAMAAGEIAWTTVTSSGIARSLVRLFGEHLRKTKLVSISAITSQTLTELGYPPAATAQQASMESLLEAMLEDSPFCSTLENE